MRMRRFLSPRQVSLLLLGLLIFLVGYLNISLTQTKKWSPRNQGLTRLSDHVHMSSYVNENEYEILEDTLVKCTNRKYLIYVLSHAFSFNRREAIRETWGNELLLHQTSVKLIFMVSNTSMKTIASRLNQERRLYKDVVVFNYVDNRSPEANDLREFLSLRWIAKNCPFISQAIIRVDDNALLNMHKFADYFDVNRASNYRTFMCSIEREKVKTSTKTSKIKVKTALKKPKITNKKVTQQKRLSVAKPKQVRCVGNAWLMTSDILTEIARANSNVPIGFKNCLSACLTDILAKEIGNVTHKDIENFIKLGDVDIGRILSTTYKIPFILTPDAAVYEHTWKAISERYRSNEDGFVSKTLLNYTEGGLVPKNFRYIINEEHICDVDNLPIFMYVFSAPSHFKQRNHIRRSWGNIKFFKTLPFRITFMLGVSANWSSGLQDGILLESATHHDIIQVDFIDSYKNLTLKGVMSLRWISKHCRNANLVMKIDDDVIVDMIGLFSAMRSYTGDFRRTFYCHVMKDVPVFRKGSRTRNWKNAWKWEVPMKQISRSTYPPYCHGPAWIATSDLIPKLYESTDQTSFIFVEDAYTTGMLPNVLGNVTYIDVPEFEINWVSQIYRYTQNKRPLPVLSIPPAEDYWRAWCLILHRTEFISKSFISDDVFKVNCT